MSNKPVQAQAYYGTPVQGQRQTLIAGVAIAAGGVPYEGDVVPVQPSVEPKGRKATKSKAV